jgi:hypothetical protein
MGDNLEPTVVPAGAHKLRRGRLTAFEKRHHRVWEGTMAVLVVAYVVLAVRNDSAPGSVSALLIVVFTAVFLGEFTVPAGGHMVVTGWRVPMTFRAAGAATMVVTRTCGDQTRTS